MFSPTLLSLLVLLPFIVVIVVVVVFFLLLLLLFPQSSWLCVTGAWAGAGYGGRGSWLGCGYGRLLGCSATWVWGQQLQPPDSSAPNLHVQRRC